MSDMPLKERVARAQVELAVLSESHQPPLTPPLSLDDQLRRAYLQGGLDFAHAAVHAGTEELAEVERLLSKKESA